MKHLVHPYWNQYPPMDPFWTKLVGAFLVLICIISFVGNGIVVYIFSTTKSLRTPANLLVLNLAFSDFLMMLSAGPMMVVNLFFETWVLGPLMCDVYSMFGSMFGCISIWSMSMIALDRYNVIVKGMAGRPMTIKLALMKILVVWSIAAFWTIGPVVGWSRYCIKIYLYVVHDIFITYRNVPEGNMTSCGIDYMTRDWNPRSYLIFYSLFVYYTPLFFICYSYWFIIAVSVLQ